MTAMRPLFPVTLEGRYVRLEALSARHRDALLAAASEDRATYVFTGVPGDVEGAERYIRAALDEAERGGACPFATVDARSGRVVGSTRFGAIERWTWPAPQPPSDGPDAVEIGWTWLARSAQRTGINTEAKLLMLTHAFEVWGVRRVTLKTDARNARSRANIERVGATLDGVLRAHMPAYDGGVRDSAVYSLLADEWPACKARLVARLR
jgi:RimJ/RimL family protein N-acetyltransferase